MAISYVGKGAVWGHNAVLSAVTTNCIGTILILSYRFKPSADKYDIQEKVGTEGRIAANPMETLTVEAVFTGTSISDAKTQAAKTPSINDIVTITDAEDTEIAGKWIVDDAEKGAETKGPKTISLTLVRFPDSAAMNGTTMTAIS